MIRSEEEGREKGNEDVMFDCYMDLRVEMVFLKEAKKVVRGG